jgi:N-methylhydantoinase B
VQSSTDVVQARNGSPPGYGDPLKRDPERVAEDVARERVSVAAAADIYGVVLEGEGHEVTVLEDETAARRDEIREQRLEESTVPADQE